jgi:hypothetical protein
MTTVLASQFSDSEGCYNNNKLNNGKYYYAELSTNPDSPYQQLRFDALGKKKPSQPILQISLPRGLCSFF